ncbi:MAG: UvrD-helicase domain-containing protein [Oscillospiraceae bacterium]|nr:UvrD-helicase domain-containing protein [Oscillospiraceae bacterium]
MNNQTHSEFPDSKSIEQELCGGLNPEQETAVRHDEGPLLILAGAGSGKTRVITYRIAYLIRVRRIHPSSILAITFTNKAANEMKERVFSLVGDTASYMWVGTFHSMFARILRRHAAMIGFTNRFSILDTDDQLKIVKECIKECDLNEKVFIPRSVLSEISRAKNEMLGPEDYLKDAAADYRKRKIAEVYSRYREKLLRNNSMDFDDILFYTVELFEKNSDVLSYYQEQFRYILVDEYQDTNHAQYRIVSMLARKYKNLCVVGDDDQSIYSFRGANIRNILDFEKDFKKTKIVKLERNYRSTDAILRAANSVISHNRKRKEKALKTEIAGGDIPIHFRADHHGSEAYYVAEQIHRLVRSGEFRYGDIAVLYRMNALSRTVESALREQRVPYRVLGGQRFYERKEIRDVMAYLRLILSSSDEYAFIRIVNIPRRGIGDVTVERIRAIALEHDTNCLNVCEHAGEYPDLSRAAGKLQHFASQISDFRAKLTENRMSFSEFIEYVQDQSGLVQEIIEQRDQKGETVDRLENLKELLSEAVEFEARRSNTADIDYAPDPGTSDGADEYIALDPVFPNDLSGLLQAYLENAALYSEGDDDDSSDDYVRLLTIHSAKGLEFKAVFIIGIEEGIFPGVRSMDREEDIEEERRLMYVAITRAKRKIFLLTARSRILFGQTQELMPSRFIKEIDPSYLQQIGTEARSFDYDTGGLSRFGRDGAGKSDQTARTGSSSFGTTASFRSAFDSKPKPPTGATGDLGDYLRPEDVTKGMTVIHQRFGTGTVQAVEKVAGDALISVLFESGSSKNMLLKQAKLKKT